MKETKNDVGIKLDSEGVFLPFPGISIISFIRSESQVYKTLCEIQDNLKTSEFGEYFSYLPPSSFHMTVFDLLCDQERIPEKWSTRYDLTADIIAISSDIENTLTFDDFPDSLTMKFDKLTDYDITFKLLLKPYDEEAYLAIRDFRDSLSRITGIKHPNHEDYKFHISLGYLRDKPLDSNRFTSFLQKMETIFSEKIFEISIQKPELVYFPDMTQFIPIEKGR